MTSLPPETDILIVGAGPTGLALAAELRRLGREPLIIDRASAGANTSRACVVHARTLEVLEPLGATGDLLSRGLKVPVFRVRDRDRPLMTIDFAQLETAYPFTLMISQTEVEERLLRRLESLGGAVQRGFEFIDFEQGNGRVRARIRAGEAVTEVSANWLIACDGMHSAVRSHSDIPFEGEAYEQSFVLADIRMEWPLSREEVTLFYSPKGLMVVAPLPDNHFRVVATTDTAPPVPPLDFIQSLVASRGPATKAGRVTELIWSSRFHVHHRIARTPIRDHVILCGDAAHVHSPAGGQGMNTGIQDAISLARTLTQAEANPLDADLQAWAIERHRVAARVVALTDRMTRVATMTFPPGRALRNALVSIVGHLPPAQHRLARTLAELDH